MLSASKVEIGDPVSIGVPLIKEPITVTCSS